MCKTGFFDDFSYFWLTLVSENKFIYTQQKKRKKEEEKEEKNTHTVWLVNYSHLRIVNKIIIFERFTSTFCHRQISGIAILHAKYVLL